MKAVSLFIALGLFSLTACMHNPTDGVAAGNNSQAEFSRVSLERTACFGVCPAYQVSVTAEGQVVYIGKMHVAVTGKHTAKSGNAVALAELWRLMDSTNFMQLPDYVPGEAACGTAATDMPTVILTASRQGQTHQVRYYTGCMDAPDVLDDIASQIDKAANSARWVENTQVM